MVPIVAWLGLRGIWRSLAWACYLRHGIDPGNALQ